MRRSVMRACAEIRTAARLFTRHQPVIPSMVALALIIPVYLWIGGVVAHRPVTYAPAIGLDAMVPVRPQWSLVYLSLFLAPLLADFVVHQPPYVRRVVHAFLAIWLLAYVFFLALPTRGPWVPDPIPGNGFQDWLLRAIHSSDVHYNCFPSLHVAQCVLASLACWRIHRGVGAFALLWAGLVGISTLYTKQHYVLDVLGGAVLAFCSYLVFLRPYPRESTPEGERSVAPILAAGAVATYGCIVAILWIAFRAGLTP